MRTRRLILLTLLGLILVLVGGYAAYVRVQSHRVVSVAPSGPYAVGRMARQWVDRTRIDQFARVGGKPRMLSVWVWYPVAPGTTGRTAKYAPGAWGALHKFSVGETDFRKIDTGTLDNATIAEGTFPLVVLMPGLGLAAPQYASIAGNLAARGYVVAGVTPSYSANLTVLDGRPVTATVAGNPSDLSGPHGDQLVAGWSTDAHFVATQTATIFPDRIAKNRVVYVGHSFGGAAAYEACRLDLHCAGAADLDGTPYGPVVTEGLTKPILLLSSGTDGAATEASTRTLFAASSGPRSAYTITGARHFDFTDYAAYYLARPVRMVLPLGDLQSRRVLTITSAYLGAFVDRVTRNTAWTVPTFPEVHPADLPSG